MIQTLKEIYNKILKIPLLGILVAIPVRLIKRLAAPSKVKTALRSQSMELAQLREEVIRLRMETENNRQRTADLAASAAGDIGSQLRARFDEAYALAASAAAAAAGAQAGINQLAEATLSEVVRRIAALEARADGLAGRLAASAETSAAESAALGHDLRQSVEDLKAEFETKLTTAAQDLATGVQSQADRSSKAAKEEIEAVKAEFETRVKAAVQSQADRSIESARRLDWAAAELRFKFGQLEQGSEKKLRDLRADLAQKLAPLDDVAKQVAAFGEQLVRMRLVLVQQVSLVDTLTQGGARPPAEKTANAVLPLAQHQRQPKVRAGESNGSGPLSDKAG